MNNIQYTIRNIPPEVDKVFRNRSKKQNKSFNTTLVEALKNNAGITNKPIKKRDLSWFYGIGGISKDENQAFEAQREIDYKAWQ